MTALVDLWSHARGDSSGLGGGPRLPGEVLDQPLVTLNAFRVCAGAFAVMRKEMDPKGRGS